jgi:hypothetical protein
MKKPIILCILIITLVLLFSGGCGSDGQVPPPFIGPTTSPGPGPSSGTTGESGLEGFQRMTLEEVSQTIGVPVHTPHICLRAMKFAESI